MSKHEMKTYEDGIRDAIALLKNHRENSIDWLIDRLSDYMYSTSCGGQHITKDETLLRQALTALEESVRFRETGQGRPPEQTSMDAIKDIRKRLIINTSGQCSMKLYRDGRLVHAVDDFMPGVLFSRTQSAWLAAIDTSGQSVERTTSGEHKAEQTSSGCKGMNCGCTDGINHSLECHAQHAAAIAGGMFVKYEQPPQRQLAQQEPIGFMSPKQISRIIDPPDESGNYIPMRKTQLGNFNLALYTSPQPNEVDELIRAFGFDPGRFRTDGGTINHLKLKAAIRNPEEYAGLREGAS